MLYNLSNKRFKHFWFALMYVAFLLVGIIYTAQLFTNYHPKLTTWQDVASYDFELVDTTFADGVLTNTYGISTPEQLAGIFNDKFPGFGGGTSIKPPDLGDIGDIIDRPPIIVGPGAGGIEIGGSGDTSIVDLDDIQKVDNVYTLLNDIDLTEKDYTWEIKSTFGEKFNGNYHTIKGLTIEESAEFIGMVGELSSGGEIKNLFLDDVDISNETSSSKTTYTGTVAGKNNGTIYNVNVTSGTVVGHSKSGDTRYVGGIVGYNDTNGKIRTCSNRASIMNGNYIGGISGYNKGTIGGASNDNSYACFNYGTITNAFSTGSSYAGGITGYSTKSISLCYNSGSITNNDYSTKNPYAGGIVGCTSGAIDQCANVGTIVSGIDKYTSGYFNGQPQFSDSKVEKSYSGGIAGYASASISNCYNTGYVSANAKQTKTYDTSYVNYNNYEVEDLHDFDRLIEEYKFLGIKYGERRGYYYYYYIKGNADNNKEKIERAISSEYAYAGGIAGNVSNDNANSANISYCYSTSKVDGGKVEYDDVYSFVLYYFSKDVESVNLGNNYSTVWDNNAVIYYLQLKYDYTYFYNPIIGAVNESPSSSGLTNTYGIYDYNNSTSASYNCTKYSYKISGRNTMYNFGVSYVDRMSELYSDEDTTSDEKDIGSGTITASKTISLDSSLFSVENISDVKIYVNLAKSNNRLTVQAQFKSNNKQEKRTLTKNTYTYTNQISASGYTKKTVSTLKSVSLGSLWSQSDSLNDGYPYLNGLYW